MRVFPQNLFLTLLWPIFIIFSGCDSRVGETVTTASIERVCGLGTVAARELFTLTCIDNANPYSDEEPEDWILLCGRMAKELYCPLAYSEVTRVCTAGDLIVCKAWSESLAIPINHTETTHDDD